MSTAASTVASLSSKVAVVVGVGPGLGSSLAKRFSAGGYSVALLSRNLSNLNPTHTAITNNGGKSLCLPTDASDFTALRTSFDRIKKELGQPTVLIYNAGSYVPGKILDLDADAFTSLFKLGTASCLVAAQQCVPAMIPTTLGGTGSGGCILMTGATASLRGSAGFAGLACPKFSLRALSQSMAREFHPLGVHVCHFIIDGQINVPKQVAAQPNRSKESFLDSDQIAEEYWKIHLQHPTVWTQELDLRPNVEKF